MDRFTPGPWINDKGLVFGKETRSRFAGGVSEDIFDAREWPRELEAEAFANARLIASAPDLLAALRLAHARFALLWPDRQPSDDAAWRAVHEAIGRAEGET